METGFRVGGWGRMTDAEDPLMELAAVRPLFVLNRGAGRYEIAKGRQEFFCPDSFASVKPASGFRVFCLGGSTVQGRPYAIETSFTTWLELGLRAADPGVEWDVVNCGGISYASYRLRPVLTEVLEYEPDLVIVCTGHNEFLEARTYHPARFRRPPFWRLQHAIGQLRLYRVGRSAWLRARGRPPARARLPAEVDAILDHRGELERYHRDDAHAQAVVTHFGVSLAAMVEEAQARGVPVILVAPPANLRDCAPFKSEDTQGLGPTELQAFRDAYESAAVLSWAELPRKIELLESAIQINPRHAGALFHLGRCYDGAGRSDLARRAYARAKDEDVCPLRVLESMREAVLAIGKRARTPVVDAHRLLSQRCQAGIAGSEMLVDHIHPSIEGHRIIAEALLAQMAEDGLVEPQDGWQERRAQLFARHTSSLPPAYFPQGMVRRERVMRWARDRWEDIGGARREASGSEGQP